MSNRGEAYPAAVQLAQVVAGIDRRGRHLAGVTHVQRHCVEEGRRRGLVPQLLRACNDMAAGGNQHNGQETIPPLANAPSATLDIAAHHDSWQVAGLTGELAGLQRRDECSRLTCGQDAGKAVGPRRDRLQTARPVVHSVHGSDVGQQRLRSADMCRSTATATLPQGERAACLFRTRQSNPDPEALLNASAYLAHQC